MTSSPDLKVGFILPSLANRGPIIYTRYLVHALMEVGVECKVFHVKPLQQVRFNCSVERLNIFSAEQMNGLDIVQTTMFRPDLYGYLHRTKLQGRHVASMHNEISSDLKFMYSPMTAKLIEKVWMKAVSSAPFIITSSNAQAQYYSQRLSGQHQIAIIGYGTGHKRALQLRTIEDKYFQEIKKQHLVIGTCGLLIKRKGHEVLLRLLAANKDMAVIIIGCGPEMKNINRLAHQLRVSERLHLIGYRENYLDYFKYFDVYVSSSYSEGFGLAIIDALGQGVPVVCTDLPIYKEYFDRSIVGLFKPGDTEELHAEIMRVMQARERFSAQSVSAYRKNFRLDTMAKKHVEFYGKICGKYNSQD